MRRLGRSRDLLRAVASTAFGATREHVMGTDMNIDYRQGRFVQIDRVFPVRAAHPPR